MSLNMSSWVVAALNFSYGMIMMLGLRASMIIIHKQNGKEVTPPKDLEVPTAELLV